MAPRRQRRLVLLLASLAAAASFTSLADGPEVGSLAPPLNSSKILQAPAGASATWAALRGKAVVIDFWATWCGPCRKSMPHWNQLAEAFKDKPVQFLAVTDEDEGVVAAFLKTNPIHSWVGLDGVGRASTDLYHIEGIPTTVIVNQQGIVVAVAHPIGILPKHIEEVIATGKSSLPRPVARPRSQDQAVEPVPAAKPVFEVSARRSGRIPPGHGGDCWTGSDLTADASGQYVTVKQAILNLFDGRPTLLDCRAALPSDLYDFTVVLPPGASHADRERAVAPMFRSLFGLEIRRTDAEREVYVLTVASTNAPGLALSGPDSSGVGWWGAEGLQLSATSIAGLAHALEGRLGRPVVDATGLTNRYDLRLKWRLSKPQLLPHLMDAEVLNLAEQPDAAKESRLSALQRRQLEAIRGNLSDAEFQSLSAEDRERIRLLRTELAKAEEERFEPGRETVRSAVREQLGLGLSLERRSVPVLVIEKPSPIPD